MESRNELIKALSNEITKSSDRVVAFRNRVAFLTWVGPILILGSAVVATKGNLPLRMINPWRVVLAGGVFSCCYMGLGWIAAQIEKQVWKQINRVRVILIRVSNDPNYRLNEVEYCDSIGKRLTEAYMFACSCVIVSAICMCVMVFNVGTELNGPQNAQSTASGVREGANGACPPVHPTPADKVPVAPTRK